MSLEAFEQWLSQAALWVVNALEPFLASSDLQQFLVIADEWLDFLIDIHRPVLWPFLVFGLTWLTLRVILRLTWWPMRLARRGAWWKSIDYLWVVVIVVTLAAIGLDVRRNAIRAELVYVNTNIQDGLSELEHRVKRMQVKCLLAGAAATSESAGVALLAEGRPSDQHCENANALRQALRAVRVASNRDARESGLEIVGPAGRTTWREFAREVDRLQLHYPGNPRLSFLQALEDRVERRDDFGPGRTRWTGFGWMDRDQATIVRLRAELSRLDEVAVFLSGWNYLFAIGLALRLVKTAAERRIEHERSHLGGLPSRVVEHFVTARGGRLTYRVLAHRQLEDGELQAAIQDALEEGRLREPEPGQTATLVV